MVKENEIDLMKNMEQRNTVTRRQQSETEMVRRAWRPLGINLTIIAFLIAYVGFVYFNKERIGEAGGIFFGIFLMPILIPTSAILTIWSISNTIGNLRRVPPNHNHKNYLHYSLMINTIITIGYIFLIKAWLD